MNQIGEDESDVQPIKLDLLENGDADGDAEVDLDVVNDVTGVDTPYEEYVDEWNKDVMESGDNAIDQDVYKQNT